MTVISAMSDPSVARARRRPPRLGASSAALRRRVLPAERGRLSCRLRRVLTDNPRTQHFSVRHIVEALGGDGAAPQVAVFAAAGALNAPDAAAVSGAVTGALGAGLALGWREVHLPRALLRRRIPRSSLALLIHSVATLLEKSEGAFQERWAWVFSPIMGGVVGLILFLLGLASMTPVVGGGVQHAASAFFIAVGLAERDGLAVVLAGLAGVACLALAVVSVTSGRKLWAKVKSWLLACARRLRLDALARLLDRCCDGLGELLQLRWGGLLLLVLAPIAAVPRRTAAGDPAPSALRDRARLARAVADSVGRGTAV